MNYSSPWTDDREAELRRRWLDGESASEIARALGRDVSRSAVIGKIHRLGIAKRGLPPTARPWSTGPRRVAPRKAPAVAAVVGALPQTRVASPPPPPSLPVARPRALDATGCRWPVGDPSASGFHYCEAEPVAGRVYCAPHCRKAGLSDSPKVVSVMGRCAQPFSFRHGGR